MTAADTTSVTGPSRTGPVSDCASLHSEEASTRRRVAASILQHGPSTAGQLAQRLELTPAAVRRHLASLAEEGQLTARAERVYGNRGRGRPAKVFVLTDTGRLAFTHAYDDLATLALDALARLGGPEAIAGVAEAALAPVVAAFAADGRKDDDPATRLVAAFNACGYAATVLPLASGRQLCQHHCPIAHVARAHPELCIAETRIISQLLDTHVQRLATIAQGDEVCTTHLPRPLAGTETERTSS